MSDEPKLKTVNLCTTEDAFERFQANSLYQEEEYITLEDLIPSENNKDVNLPESCLESNDGSKNETMEPNYDGSVVSHETLMNETKQNVVSCTPTKSGQNVICTSKSGKRSLTSKPADIEKTAQPQGRKRGRPRKNPQTEKPHLTKDQEIALSDQTKNCFAQNSTKKRGRKRKSELSGIIETENEKVEPAPNLSDSMDSSHIVSSSTMNDSYLVEVQKKGNKRGRKRLNIPLETREAVSEPKLSKSRRKLKLKSNNVELIAQIKSSTMNSESTVNGSVQPKVLESTVTADKYEKIISDTTLQNDAIDSSLMSIDNNEQEDSSDETDDICLSKLKTKLSVETELTDTKKSDTNDGNKHKPTVSKRVPKKLVSNDFEYNIDKVVEKETIQTEEELVSEQTIEQNNEPQMDDLTLSKRPARRRTKPVFNYDDESDEDPYANVELSDDEPRGRKRGKYNDDYEYLPKSKCDSPESSLESDNGLREPNEEKVQRKKKTKSPNKRRNKKTEVINISNSDVDCEIGDMDIESSLKGTVLFKKGTSEDITDFLAKKIQGTDIKIIKASQTPKLDIPVLDLCEAKKPIDISTQTNTITTACTTTQTDSQHDLAMKKQVILSSEQAEKACEFLKSIVQTTAELGELMTQKSRDFIAKKINTTNVTDTYKMDYCVKKSFLLFKLAKHNLMQMEQDLETKYEEFLEENDLLKYRESKRVINPQQTSSKSDSDCEIVEVKPTKPKFNPKTVFLNKELSIKIAKTSKPESSNPVKKCNVKGRHTVWINDSVMVKKVQPNQSFLAQDSRNKKPPDCITYDMVKSFFDDYYKKQNITLYCRPFTSMEWLSVRNDYICNYFIRDASEFETVVNDNLISISETNIDTSPITITKITNSANLRNPKPLLTICVEIIQKQLYVSERNDTFVSIENEDLQSVCRNEVNSKIAEFNNASILPPNERIICQEVIHVASLKCICISKINSLFRKSMIHETKKENICLSFAPLSNDYTSLNNDTGQNNIRLFKVRSLSNLCFRIIQKYVSPTKKPIYETLSANVKANEVQSLTKLSFDKVEQYIFPKTKTVYEDQTLTNEIKTNTVQYLSKLCFDIIKLHIKPLTYSANSLLLLSIQAINQLLNKSIPSVCIEDIDENPDINLEHLGTVEEPNCLMPMIINCVSTVTEEVFSNLHPEEASFSDDNNDYIEDDRYETYDDNDSNSLDESYTEQSYIETKAQIQKLCCNPDFIDSPDISNLDKDSEDLIADECSIAHIKLEPEEPENFIIKSEPLDVDEDLPEPVPCIRPKQEPIDGLLTRRNSYTCAEEVFETFASTVLNGQRFNRIRPQHTPDTDTIDDKDDLLVPRSVEHAKDMLMENSSDEDSNVQKSGKKKAKSTKSKKNAKNKDKETETSIKENIDHVTPNESSESETELSLRSRKCKKQTSDESKNPENKINEKIIKSPEKEIQCNNVDSTEMITSDIPQSISGRNTRNSRLRKRGISLNQENVPSSIEEQSSSSIYDDAVPAELLECEPDITVEHEPKENKSLPDNGKQNNKVQKDSSKSETKKGINSYVEKNGWKCYAVDYNDSKLYDKVSIVLEKLPAYSKNEDDSEVDRLTNLNSLHRSSRKDQLHHRPGDGNVASKHSKSNTESNSKNENIINDEDYAEFTPSEDEGDDTHMQVNTVAPANAENCEAKNRLMDDNESDSDQADKSVRDITIKLEPEIDDSHTVKSRPGPKSKKKVNVEANADNVMLTADIMMHPELTRLNGPALLKEEIPDVKQEPTLPDAKDEKKIKNSPRLTTKKAKVPTEVKQEDDSSSEEEKQWVSTKEKLLKRMGKKNETVIDDEAKGAKRVSDFIERRGDAPEPKRAARARRCSKKKRLEKSKQMKVLAKELLGDQLSARKYAQNYGKGRRNIRKVLNKQLLKDDTKRANIEEADRKSRILVEQTRLRTHLGCEDGVNVIVINDELCLEYDFDENRPLVAVHPFFTKVMKAHQYEGVKFMWDACFEKAWRVRGGHAGGGCILAHCMGLGKTLQVLALLHTVLTHPLLNMKRVLVVCPLSTVLNWVDEIHKWIGPVTDKIKSKKARRKLQVFELSKLKKTYERAYQLEDWYSEGGIFIIGYELFRCLTTLDPEVDDVKQTYVDKIRTALLDPGPDIIVCDEGHLLKNDCSVLAVAMSRVATKRRIVLTGTPMQNNLREYYCMVNFIRPCLLGTYSEYSNRFENPIMNGQHRDSSVDDIRLMKQRTHILHKVLEGCLQRQEASVLYPYLPKKYEYTVFIPLTKCQQDIYKHYLSHYASKGKQSLLKDFHVLQKIWTHPKVLHIFQTRPRQEESKKIKAERIEDDLAQEEIGAAEDAPTEAWWLNYCRADELDALHSSNKLHIVFRLLHECVALGDKVLIFSTSLVTMDALESFLRALRRPAWRLGHEYYRLDGSVPPDVRQKWCREFNDDNNTLTKLFLVSTRAGCLGLNMTAANRVIILDTSWNPAHDIQSIFRVYRFGQKKDCFIYRLVAMGTMEQKIYERSVTKQAVACRVVDEQQIDRHYNSAELTELYSWDSDGWGVSAGIPAGVRDTALLRAAGGGAVHAVREHDSLLRGSEPALPESERAAAWDQFQLEHAQEPQPSPNVSNQPLLEIEIPPLNLNNTQIKTKIKQEKDSEAKDKTDKQDEPSTSKSDDSDKKEDLVKKIMSILIENKFDDTIQAKELATLTHNVRKLLASGLRDSRSINDPIAVGIAQVLLHDSDSMETSQPDNSKTPASARKKRSTKSNPTDLDTHNEDVNSSDPEWVGDTRYEIKKKKQEDVIESFYNETVLPADDNASTRNVQNDRIEVDKDNTKFGDSNNGDSILISDDEVIESQPPPAVESVAAHNNSTNTQTKTKVKKERKSHTKAKTTKKPEKPLQQTTDNKDKRENVQIEVDSSAKEIVPLHPSLLLNVNFIRLVSNVYLRGNSKLSEDAAMMAAQYSTSKARSEYEATGAPITSGSLYEIAVEHLGIKQLKQIYDMITMGPHDEQQPSVATTSSETHRDADVQVIPDKPPKKPKPGPKSMKVAGPKSKTKKMEDSIYLIEDEVTVVVGKPQAPEPTPQNVYPVGMFIGPNKGASEPPIIEECILPDDDDDDIIITSQKPQATDQPETPIQTVTLQKLLSSEPKPVNIQPDQRAVYEIKRQHKDSQDPQTSVPEISGTCKPKDAQRPAVNYGRQRKSMQCTVTSEASKSIEVQQVQKNLIPENGPIIYIDSGNITNVPVQSNPQPVSEPICLSDSDDELPASSARGAPVAVHYSLSAPNTQPLASKAHITPTSVNQPQTIPAPAKSPPEDTPIVLTTSKIPNALPTASFTGGTPFLLTPSLKKVLDPNKKYLCIKASSFNQIIVPNATAPEQPMPLNNQKTTKKTSLQKEKISTSCGTSEVELFANQSQNKRNTQQIDGSHRVKCQPPITTVNKESKPPKGTLNNKHNNSSSQPTTNSTPSDSRARTSNLVKDKKSLDTACKNKPAPKIKQKEEPTTSSSVPNSLFKDVVRISAESYASENPPPNRTKIIVARKLPPIDKQTNKNGTKASSNYSTERPSTSGLPKSRTTFVMSAEDKRKHKLLQLKHEERAKFASLREGSLSSKRPSTTYKTSGNVIDLTFTKKRPSTSTWIDNKQVKKTKRIPTLEDFNLDDIDDITELE